MSTAKSSQHDTGETRLAMYTRHREESIKAQHGKELARTYWEGIKAALDAAKAAGPNPALLITSPIFEAMHAAANKAWEKYNEQVLAQIALTDRHTSERG